MAKHTLTEAARLAGIARSTIYRHIETGRVSKEETADGAVIDTSELLRAYRDLPGLAPPDQADRTDPETPAGTSRSVAPETGPTPWDAGIDAVAQRIEAAHARETETLRERIAEIGRDRDAWRAQAERQTLLLERTTPPRTRSFLDRIRGR